MSIPTDRRLMVTEIEKQKIDDALVSELQAVADDFYYFLTQLSGLCNKRFLKIENKSVWLDRDVAGIYPQWDLTELRSFACNRGSEVKAYDEESGYIYEPVTKTEGLTTFKAGNGNPYMEGDIFKCGRDKYTYYWYDTADINKHCSSTKPRLAFKGDGSSCCTTGCDGMSCSSRSPLMAIHRFKDKDAQPLSYPETMNYLLSYELVPVGLDESQKKLFTGFMAKYYQGNNDLKDLLPYLGWQESKCVFEHEAAINDYLTGKYKPCLGGRTFDYQRDLETILSGKSQKITTVKLFKELLTIDQRRAKMAPYTEDQLSDPNKGDWELFEQQLQWTNKGTQAAKTTQAKQSRVPTEQAETVKVEQPVFAKPPQMDIVRGGTVGIDFGTKSTVVARRKNADERLLRVGKGNYTAAPTLADYENPTVIELRDIDAFREAYAARSGRPFTEWEQLTVSHQASNVLYDKGVDSSVYYSVFGELKQWANDKQRHLLLRDRQGHTLELRPYLELGKDDFDPIEVYAYYLGLYINNMTNGVYLDYILSFPVNYSKDVREHLLASFDRGLRKSLPPAILNDAEAMRLFRVYAGASEPAAYAICALKELQLEPKEPGQKVSYAVFDFGGGTTDFDFGTEEKPIDKRRNFVVHQFGKGGDVHLGGENLLNLLAYDVYKANIKEMREKSIPFVLPTDSGLFADSFAGAERLVYEPGKASQQAYMNRKLLAQLLRPVWERHEGYAKLFEQGSTDINLYSLNDGKQELVPVKLTVNVANLEKIIKERIRYGVQNFFQKMNRVFTAKERLEQLPIHILLAGNSCKSPVVKELFDEAINQIEQEGAKTLLEQYGTEANADNLFKLHLPLGMETGTAPKAEAKEQKETPAQPQPIQAWDKVRTGKTGVVFGLLRSRKGGKDVRIVNEDVDASGEASFAWYLGNLDTDNKFHVVISLGVGYGDWARFDYADEEDFELYYTSDAQAPEGKLPASAVKMVRCRLDANEVDESDEAAIYIRKVAPDVIEYAAGRAEDFASSETKCKVHKQTLR